MLFELFLIALLLYCVLFKLKIRRMDKLTENICGEKSYPLVGHAHMLFKLRNLTHLRSMVQYLTDRSARLGIYKFWAGPMLILAISDPKYIEVISTSPFTTNKGKMYDVLIGDALQGIFAVEGGEKWKELKKPFVKTLTKKMIVSNYFKTFVEKSNQIVQYIHDQKTGLEFNIFQLISNSFTDIFSETHLGVHTDEVNMQKFNYMNHFQAYLVSKLMILFRYSFILWKLGVWFSANGRPFRKAKEGMDRFHQWILAERAKQCTEFKESKDDVEYYPDFLLRRAALKKIPFEDIKKELTDIIIAAIDTTAVATSSALVYLAMFPEVQEKAYQEQISIFGNSNRDPTFDDLSSMVYLNMIIKETLRIVSPPGIGRTASEDILLDEYTVPKGATIYLLLLKLHFDPKYWQNPTQFHPNHFLPEKVSARPTFAYVPFGVSPRGCPGMQYGVTLLTVMLSTVLRKFELKTSMKYEDIVYDYHVLQEMHGGYNIAFFKRNKS